MKLIKITIKSRPQLKSICNWYNDSEMNKYLIVKKRTMKKMIEIVSNSKLYNFIINENDINVGYLLLIKKSDYAYPVILISKKYWGKGYGKQAMILAESKVKKMRKNKIVLGVFKGNKRAYNLYKHLGYKLSKLNLYKDKKIIVMEKQFK